MFLVLSYICVGLAVIVGVVTLILLYQKVANPQKIRSAWLLAALCAVGSFSLLAKYFADLIVS